MPSEREAFPAASCLPLDTLDLSAAEPFPAASCSPLEMFDLNSKLLPAAFGFSLAGLGAFALAGSLLGACAAGLTEAFFWNRSSWRLSAFCHLSWFWCSRSDDGFVKDMQK